MVDSLIVFDNIDK